MTICSLCILTICNLVISRFGFEGWIWGLIASVPGLCILFTFLLFVLQFLAEFPMTLLTFFPRSDMIRVVFFSVHLCIFLP